MRVLKTLVPVLSLATAHSATVVEPQLNVKITRVAPEHPALSAIVAFNEGKEKEAVRLAEPLAEAGNAEALLILGLAHELGRGAAPSRDGAIDSYRKAVRAGNKQAALRLVPLLVATGDAEARGEARGILEDLGPADETGTAARMLGTGLLERWFGGEPDFSEVRKWLANSADRGDTAGMVALGRLLNGEFGFPDKKDPAAAMEQFLKAASLGDPTAMVAAGSRLLSGDEAIRDEELGREWLAKALEKEHYDAYLALGHFEQTLRKDEKAALVSFRQGAENGHPACMVKLAGFHLKGLGGAAKDPDEALQWFKKAGQAGDLAGYLGAARVLVEREEPSEALEGFNYLLVAADAGLAEVQNEVGMHYLSGRFGVRDATAAAGWFGRASAAGLVQGTRNLGGLYERGFGVPQDFDRAGRLYTQAASAGHPQATTALGRLHRDGLGTPRNLPKAWALFTVAVELGDAEARGLLEELNKQLTDKQVAEGRKVLEGIKKPPGAGGGTE